MSITTRLLASIGGAIALSFALVPGMAKADVSPEQVPPKLEAAIEEYIESRGHEYAGLCVEVNQQQPLPFGEYCAFVLTIEHNIADVSYGPVASNDLSMVYFEESNGEWELWDGQPQTPQTPPASSQLPPGLEDAIRDYIESKGHEYAGLCVDVNQQQPLPFGEYCAFVLTIEHNIADVSYGPVASNELSMVYFEEVNGEWELWDGEQQTPEPSTPTATPTTQPTATPTQPTTSPTQPSTVTVPPALAQAIKAYIESKGHQYAGLCVDVNQQQPLPFGKYCAFVLTIEHNIADVSYGPVASNELSMVYFEEKNGAWTLWNGQPQTQVPATPTKTAPLPPSTGSGGAADDGDGMMLALLALLGAGATIAAGGALALRAR